MGPFVELLTRVTTQYLAPDDGDEKTALDSIYAIFPLTREIMRTQGSGCGEFAKLAIPVLNQVIRPFTSRWHGLFLQGAFHDPERRREFRVALQALQALLVDYTRALASMADVENLTTLEMPAKEVR
jgi:hypothetical protein